MKKIKKPKLIIFDLDGTLVEFPIDYMFTKTRLIIEELSHPEVSNEELMDCFSDFDFFRFVQKEMREDFIKKFVVDFTHSRWFSLNPFPETLDVLKELHSSDVKLAIATSRVMAVEDLKQSLHDAGFLPYIDQIKTREGEHVSFMDKKKQLQDLFLHYQVDPADCLKIGDIPSDIICAKEMGVGTTVAVLSGKIKEEVLKKSSPDYIISDISQLLKLFF